MLTLPTSDNRLEPYKLTGTPLVARAPRVALDSSAADRERGARG